MTARVTALGLAALLAALVTAPAIAETKLEGEYQLMLDMRKSQRFFPWDWDSNNNDNWTGAQVRMFSVPMTNTEAFMKFEADWNNPNNNSARPEFQFREAHLRYRWDLRGRGLDSYLFTRQDRFWVDNRLIRVVDGTLTSNGNATGARLDTWGFWGLNTTFIASDFSDQFNPASFLSGQPDTIRNPQTPTQRLARERLIDQQARLTDDAYVVRVRRTFLDREALRLGYTFNRKVENQANERIERAEVHAFDSRYTWEGPQIGPFDFRGVDLMLEYAESRSPISPADVTFPGALDREISLFKHSTGISLPDRSVVVGEIRTLRVGSVDTGYLNFAPTWWSRGPLWDNRAGDSNRDETGFNLNTYYLLPERAITYTNNWRRLSRRAFERREETELYNELYIEFVNGFTGKTYYRQRDIRRDQGGFTTVEEHDDWFNELQVESRLAWMRVQTKVKDIGEPTRKELYSLETAVNLTDKLKVYNRFAFGNDAAILRKGVFSQLQYRPTGNMEIFLEYGPSWIGDSPAPVDDGDLEGGGDQTDIFKLIVRGQF